MKTSISFILSNYTLKEYDSMEDLENSIHSMGVDGMEVVRVGDINLENTDLINGVHLPFFTSWMDYYLQNTDHLVKEFGSLEKAKSFYGYGPDKLHKYYESDLKFAEDYGEYTVFHLANIATQNYLSSRSYYTSKEVIETSLEMINKLLQNRNSKNLFLLENLYYSGLTFLEPKLTEQLIEGLETDHKGFMLDTGHLMCTNPRIRTEEEGWDYVLDILKMNEPFLKHIRGIHLHATTGSHLYHEIKENPPAYIKDFDERFKYLYDHVGEIDQHRIATSDKVNRVLDLVQPDFLTLEFKSNSRQEQEILAKRQMEILNL